MNQPRSRGVLWRVGRCLRLEGRVGEAECWQVQVGAEVRPALWYPDLGPGLAAGDRVLVNVTAVTLGLGTGGYDVVAARLEPGDPPAVPLPGHLMKLRYTPWQFAYGGPEEPDDPRHGLLAECEDLQGMPVVACSLHSQVPLVAAGVAAARPGTRVAYVMTDGGALPAAVSRLLPAMRRAQLVHTVITAGQAFGGDLEAVNLYSALLQARAVVQAEVTVVGMGPGVVGTGTPLATTGVEVGEIVNAVAALGGRPVVALRASRVDPRPRHRGLSHHTRTALARLALVPAHVAVPGDAGEDTRGLLAAFAEDGRLSRHVLHVVDGQPALDLLARCGLQVTTMGRGPAEDPVFFLSAGAAGVLAARLLAGAGSGAERSGAEDTGPDSAR